MIINSLTSLSLFLQIKNVKILGGGGLNTTLTSLYVHVKMRNQDSKGGRGGGAGMDL